jgi:XTP/dITP diphosphohydrolase
LKAQYLSKFAFQKINFSMTTFIFATHNQNKVFEISPFLSDQIQIKTLNDLSYFDEIPETADTIEGNAFLKANFVFNRFKNHCFADDTGLEVESLNGEPGVFSARYAGLQKNAADNIEKLLANLKPFENRNAQFKTVIGLFYKGVYHEFTGIVKGKILHHPVGNEGFGYDPVFVPEGYDRTFAQMSLSEKSKISHRGLAMQKLIDCINQ